MKNLGFGLMPLPLLEAIKIYRIAAIFPTTPHFWLLYSMKFFKSVTIFIWIPSISNVNQNFCPKASAKLI